jgi:hypothetical protein
MSEIRNLLTGTVLGRGAVDVYPKSGWTLGRGEPGDKVEWEGEAYAAYPALMDDPDVEKHVGGGGVNMLAFLEPISKPTLQH